MVVHAMKIPPEVVITGVGVVSPIGIGADAFWHALLAGESGIRPIDLFDSSGLTVRFGGQIPSFDPKLYVRPRKSLKVMSREIQIGFAAADLAMADAAIASDRIEPERFGVVFGNDMIYADLDDLESTYRRARREDGSFAYDQWSEAIHEELHPLWLLKHLPNMTASHIAIAQDARGPNNTIVLGDVSGLLAVAEAASVIQRGWADVMLAGGTGCRLHPTAMVARGNSQLSKRSDDYEAACRPFDRDRDGLVNSEGAGVLVLESREHADRRGARIRSRLLATAARCEPRKLDEPPTGRGVQLVLREALRRSGLDANSLGHINAHGLSTIVMDRAEAQAIAAEVGGTPVTAPKGNLGHAGAGSGLLELAASVLAVEAGTIPPTRNYQTADPECPIQVVHGEPLKGRPGTAIAVNFGSMGQAAAVAIAAG
jgi:3-oxoacyl-[acyl-carrier-protein] synthase II